VPSTYTFTLAPDDLTALGVGDREALELDLAEVTIQEAYEVQRRTGVTPRGLLEGLREMDAAALYAGVWLALRHAGQPRPWLEVDFKVFPPAGKASPADEEPSTSG
jgi:hypothetical protein